MGTVTQALEASGLPSAQLELELTERMLMDGDTHAQTLLPGCRRWGCSWPSTTSAPATPALRYLKRFNLDTLKIDRSFVQDMPNDLEDNAIAVAVIALARSLKLRVVAEGVQSAEQRRFLVDLGCDEMQGWLLSRPLEADAFEAWWREHLAETASAPETV